jgi:hypothetical protein
MATVEASLTANAILAREVWRDSFTRTAGPTTPYAPTDWGGDWTVTYVQSGGVTWVDGNVARATAGKSVDLTYPNTKRVSYGFVQYDFWVPANTSDTRPYWQALQGGEYPVGIEVYQDTGPAWRAGIYHYYQSVDAYYSFTPTASTWYRVKGFFNGCRGGLLAVKVWKVGDPEPGAFNAIGEISPSQAPIIDPNDWFDLYLYASSPAAEEMGFDNFVVGDYGTPYSLTVWGSLTAGAILSKTMPAGSFSADAFVTPLSFTAGAWIIGGRSGHSRFYDHYGTEPDTVVVIDGAIGPYASGTTVHAVLTDLAARISALESGNHVVGSFTAGAFILPRVRASAVIFKTVTYDPYWLDLDLKVDAVIVRGKTNQLISADAVIIKVPAASFSADAYLIDLVC